MLTRSPSPYSAVTLAIFAALALLLLFTGCGPVGGPYLHTGLDSADTGEAPPVDTSEIGEAYADVAGLPADCHSVRPYVKLPQDENGEARTHYTEAEVNLAVRGDADYAGPPVVLYPVINADTDGLGGEEAHWLVSGWWTYDANGSDGRGYYRVRHGNAGEDHSDGGGPLEPFTLACG